MVNQPYQSDPQHPVYLPAQEQAFRANDDTVQIVNAGDEQQVESQSVHYVDPAQSQVESRAEVYKDKIVQRVSLRYWTTTGLYFFLGVLEVILGLRFIFRLFGASQSNDFIIFLYSLSHVFVGPFNGIFNDQTIGTSSVFEFSTIVAMLIYALVGWGLVSLCRVIFTPAYSSEERVFTRRSR